MISHDFKPTLGGEAEFAYSLGVALRDHKTPLKILVPPCEHAVIEDEVLGDSLERHLELKGFASVKKARGLLAWPAAMVALTRSIRRAAAVHDAEICLVTSHMTWIILALEILRLKYVLVLHGEEAIWMLKRGPISRWLFLRACSNARWIFFNSEFSRSRLLSSVPALAAKSEAVGCGVRSMQGGTNRTDRIVARQSLGWHDEPVLVTVAQLVARKGIDTVIRAVPAILEQFPSCRYVVVGAGPERDALATLSCELGVDRNVDFVGRVDDERKGLIYDASDIFVMVSQSDVQGAEEGFGIVFLEANLHGLPVVASRCGGIVEAVEDGVNGILVDQCDSQQVAEAVTSLLLDPKQRSRLAEAGRQRIREKYNWPAIANRVAERIDSINAELVE